MFNPHELWSNQRLQVYNRFGKKNILQYLNEIKGNENKSASPL